MIESLKDYLSLMQKTGQLLKIKEKVHVDDIPERIEQPSQCQKVLLFKEVRHYTCLPVANHAPSRNVFKMLFQTEDPYQFFIRGIQKVVKTIKTAREGPNFLPNIEILREGFGAVYHQCDHLSVDPGTGVVG